MNFIICAYVPQTAKKLYSSQNVYVKKIYHTKILCFYILKYHCSPAFVNEFILLW